MAILCPRCSSVDLVSSVNAAGFECPSCKTQFNAVDAPTTVRPMDTDELQAAFGDTATGESTRTGERIGPYRIEGVLGKGGMGIVYRAVHEQLQRNVALKMVRAPSLDDPEHRARLLTEARSVARLQHAHIVQIFDVGEADGSPYFALELVEGGTLADLLEYGPLTAERAADLVRRAALAMEVAHAAGVIHRDLKPANIMLTGDGLPKVTDFGLARQVDDPGLTRTGAVIGTPSYMAPEQAGGGGRSASAAADIYALGGILYAAVTGRPPFQAASALETIEQVRTRAPVSPRTLVPTLPVDLETIALKCLQKEPDRRYRSARELAEDLERFLNHQPIVARPVSTLERTGKWVRRNPAPAALIAAAIVVPIASLLGWMAYQDNQLQLRQQRQADEALQASMTDKLSTALEEMHAHIDASRWQEAYAAAERATSVSIEGVDAELVATAARFHRDLSLVVDLEQIWQRQTRVDTQEGRFRYQDSQFDYDALFRGHGLHRDTLSASDASARLAGWPDPMREAALVSLEDWMLVTVSMEYERDEAFDWVVETLQSSDPRPWRRSVRSAILAGDTEQLHGLLDDPAAVEESPESLRIVARILRDAGEHDRALRLLYDSHTRNPGNFWSNHSLAMQLVALDPPRWEESLRYFASALALDPDNAGILVNTAISHAKLGESQQAEALFREAVRLEPDYAAAHYNLGRTLFDRGDVEGAVAAYERAIEIRPEYASAHFNLGVVENRGGSPQAALDHFDRALEIEPDNPEYLATRAIVLLEIGQRDEAVALLKRAIEIDPAHVNGNATLGTFYSRSGDVEQAEALYRHWIDADREQSIPYYNLASMLTRLGRNEEAVELFGEAVRLAPGEAEYWCNYSDALQNAGRFVEALDAIVEGHRLGSARPDWPYPSAAWLAETRAMAELEGRMDALLGGEETFDDALTQLHFARMLRIKQRFADALRMYREAFEKEPVHADDLATGHRYWAAHCAGLLAGDPNLSDMQRAELARQACQWLGADVQLRRRSLEGATVQVRQNVEQKLNLWLRDEGFTSIRDAERLAELPTDLQEICHRLWKDVRDTLEASRDT